tara:strand:- start:1531 stop:1815 length:285 start_codon:yes stop_codon:yes gene_type:complete
MRQNTCPICRSESIHGVNQQLLSVPENDVHSTIVFLSDDVHGMIYYVTTVEALDYNIYEIPHPPTSILLDTIDFFSENANAVISHFQDIVFDFF